MPDQRAYNLTFAIERYEDFIVVHCSGRLVSGVNQQLNIEVGQLLPGPKRIVLDFEHLTHMDSSGPARWFASTSTPNRLAARLKSPIWANPSATSSVSPISCPSSNPSANITSG